MIVSRFPARSSWKELLKRPVLDNSSLEEKIIPILKDVKKNGDAALRKYTLQFDKAELSALAVSEQEMHFALNQVDTELFDSIKLAAENITAFHRKQIQPVQKIETMPGVTCWRKSVGIEKSGIIYSRRHSAAFLYRINAGYSSNYRRL